MALSFQDFLQKRKHDENMEHTSKSINKSLFQIAFNSLVLVISARKICIRSWKFLCSNDVILSFLRTVSIAWKNKNQRTQLKQFSNQDIWASFRNSEDRSTFHVRHLQAPHKPGHKMMQTYWTIYSKEFTLYIIPDGHKCFSQRLLFIEHKNY